MFSLVESIFDVGIVLIDWETCFDRLNNAEKLESFNCRENYKISYVLTHKTFVWKVLITTNHPRSRFIIEIVDVYTTEIFTNVRRKSWLNVLTENLECHLTLMHAIEIAWKKLIPALFTRKHSQRHEMINRKLSKTLNKLFIFLPCQRVAVARVCIRWFFDKFLFHLIPVLWQKKTRNHIFPSRSLTKARFEIQNIWSIKAL